MAEVKEPQKVAACIGLIFVSDFAIEEVMHAVKSTLGDYALRSDTIPFTHTTYYNKEMGNNLSRQWCVYTTLVEPDILVGLKHTTNELEKKHLHKHGGRQVNIDPGLLSLNNLILASTKNYSHRIYLGRGIYGEVTLIYKDKKFSPLAWTYPDYREPQTLDFFARAREYLKEQYAVLRLGESYHED